MDDVDWWPQYFSNDDEDDGDDVKLSVTATVDGKDLPLL